jgi:hypothetical protein
VFRFAITTLRASADPTRPLRGTLLSPKVRHWPAITDGRRRGMRRSEIDFEKAV